MIGLGIVIFKKPHQIEVHKVSPWELTLAKSPRKSKAEQEHLLAAMRVSGKDWKPDGIFTEQELRQFVEHPHQGEFACDTYLIIEFPDTDCWLVRRHGINASNQDCSVKPVAIVLHKQEEEARKIADEKVPVMSGQFLELITAAKAEFKEWMEVTQQDAKFPNTVVHE